MPLSYSPITITEIQGFNNYFKPLDFVTDIDDTDQLITVIENFYLFLQRYSGEYKHIAKQRSINDLNNLANDLRQLSSQYDFFIEKITSTPWDKRDLMDNKIIEQYILYRLDLFKQNKESICTLAI